MAAKRAWGRYALIAAGGTVAVAVLLVLAVKFAPQWLASTEGLSGKERAEEVGRVRTAVLGVLVGVVTVLGAVYTARTYELSRRRHDLDREGLITERFTRAVEQLGHERSDVQVGGIYALERVMRDSPRDHAAVVDVLNAFVREHAAAPTDLPPIEESGPGWSESIRPERRRGNLPTRPRVEIQAAMAVLGRRPERPDDELDALRLSDIVLRRALLRDARLSCARLRGAHLEYAQLERAKLDGARMPHAHLNYADLTGAHLERAYLKDAHLDHAMLNRARLNHAVLSGASLDHAVLTGAKLDHATLVDATMVGANLDGASLLGSHLAGMTGSPALTPEQRLQPHCSPSDPSCKDADTAGALPDGHPCVRYERSAREAYRS